MVVQAFSVSQFSQVSHMRVSQFFFAVLCLFRKTRKVSPAANTIIKTDDDTKRQLVHTLAHAIVFIVSICCL